MKYFTIILLLICSQGIAGQTQNEKLILNKLAQLEEGDTIRVDHSWVIDSNGDTVRYADYMGKWLLIDFWSTGCGPCIKTFPKLPSVQSKYADNLNVIAVSVDSKYKRYRKSAKKYDIKVPTYFGGFTYANDLFNLNIKVYKGTDGTLSFRTLTPQYVLIDPQGRIASKDMPAPGSKEFDQVMAKVFN